MTNPDVDDSTPGWLEAFLQFGVSVDGLTKQVTRMNDTNDARDVAARRNLPRQIPLIQELVNGNPAGVIKFGSPQAGRKWEVRVLGVVSLTSGSGGGFVVMANTVGTWYVGPDLTGIVGSAAGTGNAMAIRWQFASVPSFKDFSADQIAVLPNEQLILGLTAVPANPTQIYGIAVVDDLPLYVGRGVAVT